VPLRTQLQVVVVKEELKCPWCDANFEDTRELDTHARKHYSKELIAQQFHIFVKSKPKVSSGETELTVKV